MVSLIFVQIFFGELMSGSRGGGVGSYEWSKGRWGGLMSGPREGLLVL